LSNVGAGHDVPTGVTLRNLILLITARDREGAALPQVSGPTVPNWGGVGDPTRGNLAGLPGKGYARVLVDDFLAENVLFTAGARRRHRPRGGPPRPDALPLPAPAKRGAPRRADHGPALLPPCLQADRGSTQMERPTGRESSRHPR